MFRLAVFAAIALLTGCAASEAPSYSFEWKGSPDRLQLAQTAVSEWRDVCGLDVSIRPAGIPIHEVEGEGHIGLPGMPRLIGYYTGGEDPSLQIRHLDDSEMERSVISHEMGHAFGLTHSEVGLMSLTETRPLHVTAEDCPR